MMNNKGYVLIAALLIIILLLVLSFYPVSINNEKQGKVTVYQCTTLTTGCKARLGDNHVEIRFPENIVFLKQFPIEVRLVEQQPNPVTKVNVDFQMVGMKMGINFYQLTQSEKNQSLWTGKGVLPVCATGRTDWQVIVSLVRAGYEQKVAFQFEVAPATQ